MTILDNGILYWILEKIIFSNTVLGVVNIQLPVLHHQKHILEGPKDVMLSVKVLVKLGKKISH